MMREGLFLEAHGIVTDFQQVKKGGNYHEY